MNGRVRVGLCAIVALAAWFAPRGERDSVLDRRDGCYLEDAAPARRVAGIRCELVREREAVRLRIAISAEAEDVEAMPGLEGVRGANTRTMEELARLLHGDALRVATRAGVSAHEMPGTFAVTRHGSLPARRIRADGSLDLAAHTDFEGPIEVTCKSAPLPPGEHDTYVVADGLPRLRVATAIAGRAGRIVAIESLGEPRSFARHP